MTHALPLALAALQLAALLSVAIHAIRAALSRQPSREEREKIDGGYRWG